MLIASLLGACRSPQTQAGNPMRPGGATWPNEPDGFVVLTDYGFDDELPLGTGRPVGSTAWSINNGFAVIEQDRSAPLSPPNVLRLSYPIGFTGGVAPATLYMTWAGSTEVYFGFWWKPSNPWQGHSSGVNKLVVLFDDHAPLGNYFFKFHGPVWGPFHTQLTFETDRGTINYDENLDTTAITLGQWHRVEFLLKRSDSTLKWWLDGKFKGSYSGVYYGGTKFIQAEVYGGWGGVGDTKTENDYYWFDHVHITGHR